MAALGLLRRRRRSDRHHWRRPHLRGPAKAEVAKPASGRVGSGYQGECAMDNESEVIRQQMEQTRSALTAKVELLEHQVVETVHGATAAVSETVGNVKDVVQETVQTVKDSVHETV